MSNGPFITIAEFMLPSDVLIARGRLESEGIECFLKDELTVQVHNFISNAVGGIKLQVRPEDAARATAFLLEWGIIKEEVQEISPVWAELDEWTRKIPLIGKLDLLVARLLVLISIVLFVALVPIGYSMRPVAADLLTKGQWCVDHVVHDGMTIEPGTTGFRMIMGCPEKILFDVKGSVQLPGFGTPAQAARWSMVDDKLWFDRTDTLHELFQEPFGFAVSERELTLRSTRTTIFCTHEVYGF